VRRVLVGTPTKDGRVDARYSVNLAYTMLLGAQREIQITPWIIVGDSTMPRARNDIMKKAIEDDFDDLLFIDDDQGWQPEWILELLEYPVDFVGMPVRKKSDDMIDFNVKVSTPKQDKETGLIEVDSVGTGILRITGKALRAIWRNSRRYTSDGRSARMAAELYIDEDGELVSEDNAICRKWRNLGGKVYVAGHMNPQHIGTKVYVGNFLDTLEKVMELRNARGSGE